MRRTLVVIILILLVCGMAVTALALEAGEITFVRTVFSGGGQPATGSGMVLNGTLGEPIAGALEIGTAHGLSSGFWQPFPPIRVYLPLVQRDA